MPRRRTRTSLSIFLNGRLVGQLSLTASSPLSVATASALSSFCRAEAPVRPYELSGRPVGSQEIADMLANLRRAPLGLDESGEFRISLPGTQHKTALLYWDELWHVPHGASATTHLLKPEIGKLPNGIDLSQSIENEHLCMRLAAAFGLPVAKTAIRDFAGRRALVVERFDRKCTRNGRLLRVPQEDCCQALSVPPTRKYEPEGGPGMRQILELLKASDAPAEDRGIFLKAQILFWLPGATDGHAKKS